MSEPRPLAKFPDGAPDVLSPSVDGTGMPSLSMGALVVFALVVAALTLFVPSGSRLI